RWFVSLVGCGVVLASFVLAAINFGSLLATPPGPGRVSDAFTWSWLVSGGQLTINFGLLYDPLAAVMLLIVTGVGFLIHVYSIGYMAHEPGYWRFFSFLNLFVFAMTLLVTADNFLFLLVGWAGVGLASFLLIGFWYTRPSAVAAAQKAFVVNVIGDFGLMLAIFLIWGKFGSLAYKDTLRFVQCPVFSCPAPIPAFAVNSPLIIAITLLLFVAAAAKSAQFPLHVWLPDAMEGPTPVSALIHAATMVTAGVYLVARAAPLFNAAPVSLAVVAGIGGFTALFAATIACVQHDIKRVLAYSTMSQLGYMFMAEGAGGYSSGIFHLTTHAYFKALLFMAAGAVIHALAGEQDMRQMGGLRQKLPVTFWSFIFGGLALAAIFPFSGFWSKDGALSAVWQRALSATGAGAIGWYAVYAVGIITALLTGFYIFRLIFVVFLGSYRGGPVGAAHGEPHAGVRSPASASASASPSPRRGGGRGERSGPLARVREVGLAMSVPMGILALLSLVGGFDGTPWNDAIGNLLAPVVGQPVGLQPGSLTFYVSLALGLAAALAGIGIAWSVYGRRQHVFTTVRNPLYQFVAHRWYVDDLYDRVIVRPLLALGRGTGALVERMTLDGGSRGLGWATAWVSAGLRSLQTGYVRNYALGILLGAVVILLYFVVRL
ncbi:MAG TPA: NADH-quinone oxidoreductase subunit L, partial [Ktedonobacterales bacterium]